jgi:hypothetical protein
MAGMSAVNWEDLRATLLGGGETQFLFLKAGRTPLRLLWPEDADAPFVSVKAYYQGRVRQRWAAAAFRPQEPQAIKAAILPKSVAQAILDLLIEGYELFDMEKGHGITVIRTGLGLETSYNVVASRDPVPVPPETRAALKAFSLHAAAGAYEQMQEARSGKEDVSDSGENSQPADW